MLELFKGVSSVIVYVMLLTVTKNNLRILQLKETPRYDEQQYSCPQHLYT
jgi:hypothetical protein